MPKLALLVIVLLSGQAFCQMESKALYDPTTGVPNRGFYASEYWFYNFEGMNQQVFKGEFNYLADFEPNMNWNGTFVLFPWASSLNITEAAKECGPSYNYTKLERSIGYLRMKPNITDSQYECFSIPKTTGEKANWTITSATSTTWRLKADTPIETTTTATQANHTYLPGLELICSDTDSNFDNVTSFITTDSHRSLVFQISSPKFCAFSSGKVLHYFKKIKAIPAFLLIIAIFALFYGKKMIKCIMCCAGFLTGALISILVMGIITLVNLISRPETLSPKFAILAAFIIIVSGSILGYLFTKITKFVFIIQGGLIGLALSLKANELIMVSTGYSSQVLQICVMIAFVCIGSGLGFYLHDHLLILSTALGGAFLACLCFGAITHSYPDIENFSDLTSIDPSLKKSLIFYFVVYTVAWAILSTLGAYVQYRSGDHQDHDADHSVQHQDASFDHYNKYDA